MSDCLDEWQDRLERHFETLAGSRSDSSLNIFALEHGLDVPAITDISLQLRSRSKIRVHLSPHWLLWVIYATEHGYQYEGDEYWPSFEQQTPRWDGNRRYQLARWFKKFQRTYNGVVPTGRWADHFSIISRPITHAILPKYLQVQFARTLYYQRQRLIGLTALKAGDIGRRLAGNAVHASTRFQEFLQQEELTGRIVLALLGEQSVGGSEPIYPSTLQRIVEDLEKVRNAREWLGEARRYVKDRFTGIATGLPGTRATQFSGEPSVPAAPQFDVRPKLYLSHRGGGKWIVWTEVPSFREICSLSANIRSFLRGTRCRLNGADDFKPSGWLLFGNRKGALKRWPNPKEPMIRFERSEARLENILQFECRIHAGPIWLYRIGHDGTAREIVGGIVRPGGRYIIVMSGEQSQLRFGMQMLEVDCAGIRAYRLDVPADVSADFTEWLAEFKLQVARTVRVWPAGLPGRGWNGEGRSEWLTTETPFFGMAHDHPVDGYVLRLDGENKIDIDAGEAGDPVFVRLPRLSAGKHILTVKARRGAGLDRFVSTPTAEGYVELWVREPEPWIPGVALHCGLIANLDPHDADLESIWRNKVNLSVMGPASRSVAVRVRLMDRKGDDLLCERIGDRIELPLRPEFWRKKFAQFLKQERNTWIYLAAASGELEISGEELGRVSFRFEHDVPPLRWVLHRSKDNIVARLVDDTGLEERKPDVSFFNMKNPLLECRHSCDAALAGQIVEQPGGLLYARQGDFEDFVVVSCRFVVTNFRDLDIASDLSKLRNSSIVSAGILRLYSKWHNARLYGPLVNVRWEKINREYLALIYKKLCGHNWAKAEASVSKSPNSQHAFEMLHGSIEKRPTDFSAMLRRECEQSNDGVRHNAKWYAELAHKYHVCGDPILSEFAFSLATEAHRVPEVFGKNLAKLLAAVRENPTILRGARFLKCVAPTERQF
ncbi:hypothetical protein [Candidatus Rariloculus sp.]|uniref:hypothetical protein n=1 Tax=Candidatus Rariloculus sp. TaxID=3101265 RepID=UPI003D0E7981